MSAQGLPADGTWGGKKIKHDERIIPIIVDEKRVLTQTAKRYGFTWEKLHSYKKLMNFPMLPAAMPRIAQTTH